MAVAVARDPNWARVSPSPIFTSGMISEVIPEL
jgi:hypothetical protein